MAETEHEITPAGRIKAPSGHSCVERILPAWESLPSDIIKKSVCDLATHWQIGRWENTLFSERRPTKQWEGGVYWKGRGILRCAGTGAPVDDNETFADLELDIFEEERNEIVVHDD